MYKLSIGNPGSSFAIEVARRIGLDERIIADASSRIGEEFINMDNFLQSIAKDKLYWENKRKEIENGLRKSKTVTEPRSEERRVGKEWRAEWEGETWKESR